MLCSAFWLRLEKLAADQCQNNILNSQRFIPGPAEVKLLYWGIEARSQAGTRNTTVLLGLSVALQGNVVAESVAAGFEQPSRACGSPNRWAVAPLEGLLVGRVPTLDSQTPKDAILAKAAVCDIRLGSPQSP